MHVFIMCNLTKYYYDDQIENDIGMHVAFMGERLLAILVRYSEGKNWKAEV
jgi:hypothetical protein